MSGLMLSTPESGPCTREQAFSKILIPSATDTYIPLPNKDLLDMVADVARLHGIVIVNERLGMDLKGMRFFGVYDVEGKDFFGDRIKLMIGFCNSYNRSMSARVCIGGQVLVCSNRAFHAYADETSGIVGMALHPHRKNIRTGIYQRIDTAFQTIEAFRTLQNDFFNRLENTSVRKDRAYSLIVQAAQQGIINKTKIVTVAHEWDIQGMEPANDLQAKEWDWHPEFRDRNIFNLFNAFTQVEKKRQEVNPVQSNLQTMALTKFFYDKYPPRGR